MNNVNQTAKLICHAYLNLIARESINDETIINIIDKTGPDLLQFQDRSSYLQCYQ